MRSFSRRSRRAICLVVSLCIFSACGSDEAEPVAEPAAAPAPVLPAPQKRVDSAQDRMRASAQGVDDARLRGADEEAANWLSYGHGYSEQRFSSLSQIHARNVQELSLAWRFPTGLRRGHEATPLVVDGVMYLTGSWSIVFALDATTGKLLWKWDPKVSQEVGRKTCCDVVNRGVALYRGRVYVGVLDGRLAALDAATGAVVWETVTVDQSLPYTITGAPRVVDGKVIIGNGGAEFGVRGYVSAYDAETGEMVWRTYTVPGDPALGFETPALAEAAKTWNGEWWKIGGGGTAWDSMAFDPDLNLLYIGTGNGSPWSRYDRSPGGGDNLYLSSILALDPDTGEVKWHYQTTPGDNFDFTATQHMILADLTIDGKPRQVIMQAPKNGFFYVIDRATGELLSAENYVEVTWADGVDMATGRPVETPSADYSQSLQLVKPTPYGGHNWQPMAFNPVTGLVYIPAQEIQGAYKRDPKYVVKEWDFNTGTDVSVFATLSRDIATGHLLAWDPVNQREVWRHPHGLAWNGGVLTTAGNLVFQGTADGRFLALRADDGMLLWQSHHANTGIIAAPMTYRVDGVQYVAIVAGWGGTFAMSGGDASEAAHVDSDGVVLSFAIINAPLTPEIMEAAIASQDAATMKGNELYHTYCVRCHGATAMAGGVNPDLRESVRRLGEGFVPIVGEGLAGTSMPGFKQWMTEDDVRQIKAYVEYMADQTLP